MTIRERESVDLPTAFGPMRTYIYSPAAEGKYPGILLYSEIFQVTAPIGRTAALLAGHGFIVAVPEIYHEFEPAGAVFAYDQAGADRGNILKTTKELAAYDADSRAVLDHLASRSDCTGKLGAMGICIGGHLSFRAALNSDVLACVCYYATDLHKRGLGRGMNDDTLARCGEIGGEMLMFWGKQDPHISREGRRQIYDAMTDNNLNFTWHEYNAQHAFLRDEGLRYDPVLAMQTYAMTVELFKRRLS